MNYLFRQKLVLDRDLPYGKSVFVVEPEEALLDLYCQYLAAERYAVSGFKDLTSLLDRAETFQPPQLVVVNTALLLQPGFEPAKLRLIPNGAKIVSVGLNADPRHLGRLMALGVSSHLDRRLTRPADLVEIVKTLLYH